MENVPEIRNFGIISGTFFSVNRKFLGRCSGITERYRIVFRKIPVYGIVFRKVPVYRTIVPEFSRKASGKR